MKQQLVESIVKILHESSRSGGGDIVGMMVDDLDRVTVLIRETDYDWSEITTELLDLFKYKSDLQGDIKKLRAEERSLRVSKNNILKAIKVIKKEL